MGRKNHRMLLMSDTEQDQKSHEERQYRVQHSTRIATWLACIAGIIYCGIAGLQWHQMIKATKSAKQSADTASASLHLDQRAWVFVLRDNFQLHEGFEISIPGHIINTGKTTAKHVEAWITAIMLKSGDIPKFIYEPGIGIIRSIDPFLFPSQRSPFQLPVLKRGTQSAEKVILTRPLLEEMEAGTSYILMYGKITYKDVFGIEHCMTFCDIYPYPSSNRPFAELEDSYRECITYNDIDKK